MDADNSRVRSEEPIHISHLMSQVVATYPQLEFQGTSQRVVSGDSYLMQNTRGNSASEVPKPVISAEFE